MFPGSGRYPFSTAELAAACAYCALSAAFAWRVEQLRALRYVFPVYGVACLAFFFLSTAVGENIARLRYAAIPLSVLVLSLRNWRPLVPALIVLALAIAWNVTPLAAYFVHAEDDADAHEAYWQPAVSYLHAHLTPSYRVEAVDTAGHWPALYLARAGIPLARGWFRQDDFPQNELLYDDLGPKAYLGLAARARGQVRRAHRRARRTTAPAARQVAPQRPDAAAAGVPAGTWSCTRCRTRRRS